MPKPTILLANDDGIHANGIRALAAALKEIGDVWIVAPDRERSATSHAISLHKPLRIRQLGPQEYSVDGTPADCVYLAVHHLLGKVPDIVVSGINHGPNLGSDVLYSGTVSAAMEGALLGCRAVAISLCLPDNHGEQTDPLRFDVAAACAHRLVNGVVARPMPAGVLLNVNVPSLALADIRGFKLCRLGYTDWDHTVICRTDPRGRPYFWIGGERRGLDSMQDSDNAAIEAGFVSVTPVHYDLTDYRAFSYVRDMMVDGYSWATDNLGNEPLAHPSLPGALRAR